MQVWVLFTDKGEKITMNASEAKAHTGRQETGLLKRDYAKNERVAMLESGKVVITPGETKFVPNEKPAAEPVKRSRSQAAETTETESSAN